MGKLYYKYGTMSSSKTANLLMTAYNYESQGRRILCLKPALDTRWSETDEKVAKLGSIRSRALPEAHSCELVEVSENLYKLIQEYNNEIVHEYSCGLSAVLIDEAQFLSKIQVKQLAEVADKLDISVICFGLKNTYKDGELFEGSAALLYYAQSIDEIKTICKYCNRKATMNLRIVDGYAIYNGEGEVAIGDTSGTNDVYAQVCFRHYINPPSPIKVQKSTSKAKPKYDIILDYILKYNNEYGFYKKSKLNNKDFIFNTVFYPTTVEDFSKLRYLVVGPIMFDLQAYDKKFNKTGRLTGSSITQGIFNVIYTIFKDSTFEAYKILKSAECKNIEFFDDEAQVNHSKLNRTGSSLNRYKSLPDGHIYYNDMRTADYNRFWEYLLNGLSLFLNMQVGFLYTDSDK